MRRSRCVRGRAIRGGLGRGASLGSGHYTALAYNEALEHWLEYNDSTVSPAAVEAVCEAQAYLLFYHLRA